MIFVAIVVTRIAVEVMPRLQRIGRRDPSRELLEQVLADRRCSRLRLRQIAPTVVVAQAAKAACDRGRAAW